MRDRVAEHRADGLAPVLLNHRHQATFDFREGLVPCRLLEAAVALDHRRAKPVRILVQICERHALGTDIALRERVGFCAPHRDDTPILMRDLKAAAGLAERTDAVAGFDGHGSPPGQATYPRVCDKWQVCTSVNGLRSLAVEKTADDCDNGSGSLDRALDSTFVPG